MPRLIILIPPLAILLLVVLSDPSEEQVSGAVADERESRGFLEVPRGERTAVDPRVTRNEDGSSPWRPVPMVGEDEGESRRVDLDSNLSLAEKTEAIWERLADRIPADFTKEELQRLRAYIEESLEGGEQDQPWLCWAPGSSREKAMVYHEVENLLGMNPNKVGLFANQFLGSGRWGNVASHSGSTSAQGRPAVLTWSIVPDGTSSPGNSGQASAPSDLLQFLESIYGSNPGEPIEEQPWFPVLKSAFDAMGATCGVEFVFEPNDDGIAVSTFADGILGTRGDIRLAGRAIDGESDTLAFAYSPGYGDMVFDTSDSFFFSTGASSIRLHNVVTHELGHAMGLAHICPLNGTKLMEPLINLGFRGPRFDESQSLQRQYGDPLEHHSEARTNDRTSDATPLTLLIDDSLYFPRLSIDDNGDLDYFRVSVLGGQRISVEIEPALGSYFEGPQVGEDCSGGTLFDHGNIHDLTLEVLAPVGGAVLASSTSGGLGEGEVISSFEFPDDGDYFIRVNGGSADATQIYSLDIFTEDRAPRPEISLITSAIVEESGTVKNFRPDPDETLKVRVELRNVGNLATEDLQVSLSGPPNLVKFSKEVINPVLGTDESGFADLVFGLRGNCGDVIPLTLAVSDRGMETVEFELEFLLGEVVDEELINEGFDSSTSMPADWAGATTGEGANWSVLLSANSTSSPNVMFCPGVGEVGQSILTSPEVTLGGDGGRLIFNHLYDMESTWDGCVLEFSRNGGEWFDLLGSEAEVVSGGYNSTIRSTSTSGLARRDAWSGDSGTFMTTEIKLPSSWAGDALRFRWLLASDRSVASSGWYLDDVLLTTSTAFCEVHDPELAVTSDESTVTEGDTISVDISSALPLLLGEDVSLSVSGEATESDLSGDLEGRIAAGASRVVLPLLVVSDGLVEGEEAMILSLGNDGPGLSLSIQDHSSYGSWASGFGLAADTPNADSDGDQFSELAEYLLNTDPTDASSVPDMSIRLTGGKVLFPLGELPVRPDASISAEQSSEMVHWTSAELNQTAQGLEIPESGGKSFVRLLFSLNE